MITRKTNINTATYTIPQAEAAQRSFITSVYGWMALALTVTALVAMTVGLYDNLIQAIAHNRFLSFGLLIAQFVLVGWLVVRVEKMSAALATTVFFGYAALTGVTVSVVFLVFSIESIGSTFLVTGGTFAAMSAYGYMTKRDLTSFGNLAFMGLTGAVLGCVVRFFVHSIAFEWVITMTWICAFVGLVAYDTQMIKRLSLTAKTESEAGRKLSIFGALRLYLDFFNIFIRLLRLFGRRGW